MTIAKAGFLFFPVANSAETEEEKDMNTQGSPEIDDTSPEGAAPGALSPRQERALQALLTHSSLKEAAAAAGVSDATLWRYMKDAEFTRRLRGARREAVGHAAARLQRFSGDAVAGVRGDGKSSPGRRDGVHLG